MLATQPRSQHNIVPRLQNKNGPTAMQVEVLRTSRRRKFWFRNVPAGRMKLNHVMSRDVACSRCLAVTRTGTYVC
jgi:hypothetical protein